MAKYSGFIAEVAQALYNKYGDEISSLYVLFPSKRARLFFSEALSQVAGKPLWQPVYTSIDEVMEELSGLRPCDRIRLVTELYRVYSEYHNEPFDAFYFWGETLLTDFDSVDKYLIDADMLFANIADLRALEDDLRYLEPEQAEIVSRFWRSFGQGAGRSDEQQKFIEIWQTLGRIYDSFRQRLSSAGMAYTGMVHRAAAEKIKNGEIVSDKRRYVIAGFNALTECEKTLFDYLARAHEVEFFWDYDHYYIDDPEQEAGLFLRDNIARFPQTTLLPHSSRSFGDPKKIMVVESPSDSLQCKYAGRFVEEIAALSDGMVGKETAIVLTDENLLLPVLYSIPDSVDNINVTMGYPIRNSLEYSFTERLIELQTRKRCRQGQTSFYHGDVCGLLRHPFVAEICGAEAADKDAEIVARQKIYVDRDLFAPEGFMARIFSPAEGWSGISDYISEILSEVARHSKDRPDAGQRIEFANAITENTAKIRNSITLCGIEPSERVFASLLRRTLQSLTVPYEGEPLTGLQIMGILETRNLDFENVVILSVNDDTFPGNRTSPSFIPYNLKLAYGLPTPAHHEGVFAYYFYRLLQRAHNIHIVYCSRSDDKSTGEQSRYIYQLEYESPHRIAVRTIDLDANLTPSQPIVVYKDGPTMAKLMEFTREGGRRLSPTSLYNYIECPLKFYFRSIARLRKEDEVAEDVDSPMFGIILHRAMEILYTPLIGKRAPGNQIRALVSSDTVDKSVRMAINEEYLREASATEEDYGGNLLLVNDIVTKYINKCILPYDATHEGYTIRAVEKELGAGFTFYTPTGPLTVNFTGKADRLDELDNGTLRVVDYKTGAAHTVFNGIDSLFEFQTGGNLSGAVFQTLMYAMMFRHSEKRDVQPALYYVREMNMVDYSPALKDKSAGVEVERYSDYAEEFEQQLARILLSLFETAVPFVQCEDRKICQYCDFRGICRR